MSDVDPIQPGQIWASKDKRDNGRRITIVSVNSPVIQNRRCMVQSGPRRYWMRVSTLVSRYRKVLDAQ